MESQEFETKKLEYQMAQEMLRHYDALNWQIGSILIAGVLILTGFAVNKDIIELAKTAGKVGWILTIGIPALSFSVLCMWLLWFRRHRSLYNFRNEVLHRLELQLGMFHHLRALEGKKDSGTERFTEAKIKAGHDAKNFEPFIPVALKRPSGYTLAKALTFGIPFVQILLLYLLYKA